jgi:hypothetical protein
MVAVVQLVERQIVILVVAGSSPVGHPIVKSISSLFSRPAGLEPSERAIAMSWPGWPAEANEAATIA